MEEEKKEKKKNKPELATMRPDCVSAYIDHVHVSQIADNYKFFLLLICICWAALWYGLKWILIFLRIAVRGPDETPVRAPKALVLILDFLL